MIREEYLLCCKWQNDYIFMALIVETCHYNMLWYQVGTQGPRCGGLAVVCMRCSFGPNAGEGVMYGTFLSLSPVPISLPKILCKIDKMFRIKLNFVNKK